MDLMEASENGRGKALVDLILHCHGYASMCSMLQFSPSLMVVISSYLPIHGAGECALGRDDQS